MKKIGFILFFTVSLLILLIVCCQQTADNHNTNPSLSGPNMSLNLHGCYTDSPESPNITICVNEPTGEPHMTGGIQINGSQKLIVRLEGRAIEQLVQNGELVVTDGPNTRTPIDPMVANTITLSEGQQWCCTNVDACITILEIDSADTRISCQFGNNFQSELIVLTTQQSLSATLSTHFICK